MATFIFLCIVFAIFMGGVVPIVITIGHIIGRLVKKDAEEKPGTPYDNAVNRRDDEAAEMKGKTPNVTNRASREIARNERRLAEEDRMHENADCKYSVSDPNFSFNGRRVVDDFAGLRKKNAEHEEHLLRRVPKS